MLDQTAIISLTDVTERWSYCLAAYHVRGVLITYRDNFIFYYSLSRSIEA